jgi:hypothetical protein
MVRGSTLIYVSTALYVRHISLSSSSFSCPGIQNFFCLKIYEFENFRMDSSRCSEECCRQELSMKLTVKQNYSYSEM